MLNDAVGFEKIFIATGYTDLRRGIDGLASTIKFQFDLDPFQKHVLFLFCGKRTDRIKGLVWEGDGFLLLYKRLNIGGFSWPRTKEEAICNKQHIDLYRSFQISDNIRRVHLHQVRLHKKASLTGTGTTDNKNIFISCILRLFRSAGHHQPFRLCQKDIIFKHRIHIWLYVLGISPPCGTVFYTLPELLGILGFVIHHKSECYAACHTNQ